MTYTVEFWGGPHDGKTMTFVDRPSPQICLPGILDAALMPSIGEKAEVEMPVINYLYAGIRGKTLMYKFKK